MGVVVAAIAHASVVEGQGGSSNLQRFEGQGGSSNLQRFMTHHPPTFTGRGDPVVADHWFRQVKRAIKAMKITSNATRIRLATFQLEGES